ncbi:MAG: WYL domain-containing protein [Pseudomonadota bacterium]
MIKKHTFDSLQREYGVREAERLAFIDFVLQFKGALSRIDLTAFFGLKEAAASKAIAQYRELRPDNVEYERSLGKNVIVRASFDPLIHLESEVALGMLANGFNKNKLLEDSLLPYVRIGNISQKLNVEFVSRITRAISEKSAISCKYFSATSSNHGDRTLFPTAIFYDGMSWMFRAYHKNLEANTGSFKCFNFSRLVSVTEMSKMYANKGEDLNADNDWHLTTPIVLKIHPYLKPDQQAILRYEYGVNPDTDEFVINTKAVLFYYLAKQWKIDVRSIVTAPLDTSAEFYNFHLQNRSTLEHLHCMENVFKIFPS